MSTSHASRAPYRGRLAPSPTGYLHLGHAQTFWVAQERARLNGGVLVLRNEDMDAQRFKLEFVAAMLEDLKWFGFQWTEGPDRGGPFAPYNQSERLSFHRVVLEKLRAGGFIYPCTCSRKDIRSAARAPHAEDDDEPIYPGTCRNKSLSTLDPRLSTRFNWRFHVPDGEAISFADGHFGPQQFVAGRDFGDFVVWRHDDVPAYQLAVVADDAAMQITEVVRGADLLRSTARQLLLYRALGLGSVVLSLSTYDRRLRRPPSQTPRCLEPPLASRQWQRSRNITSILEFESQMIPASEPPLKRRIALKLILVTIGLLALIIVAFGSGSRSEPDQLSWLTPAEFARTKKDGPLTQLKYRVMNWTAPLWKSYWQNLPQITINSRALILPVAMTWPTNSASPFVIAANGTRAWILTPTQLKGVQTEIDSLPDATGIEGSGVVTKAGRSAAVFVMNSFGTGTNAILVGTALFLTPTTANDKIVLTLGFDHTEFETNRTSGIVGVKTNQTYACRAVFPNAGGLLLENPNPEPGSSNRYWLLLSARAVDATGRLLGR